MKNKILICAFTLLCIGSFAQTDSSRNKSIYKKEYDDKQNKSKKEIDTMYDDNKNTECYVTMTNGRMMMMENGKMIMLDREMVMRNGTVVRTDGTVKMKDGEAIRIKDGDCLDKSGKITFIKNTSVRDTTKVY